MKTETFTETKKEIEVINFSNSVEYNLYTEDVNTDFILCTMNKHFQGYTINKQLGLWQGIKENSIKITILADLTEIKDTELKISEICKQINTVNNQNCILITKEFKQSNFFDLR